MNRDPARRARKTRRSDDQLATFASSALFGDSAAGVLISGDSGAGKSNAMQVLAQKLIQSGSGLTFISPHGDDPEDLERFCAALPRSQRRRVLVIRYSDTSRITGLNPLFVESRGVNEVTYRARIASRVGHVSKILLHAFGEKDFNGKPVMFKFFNYYLMTLALTGLTIPDVRHFFDTASPVYQALTEAAPDFIAQLELEQLATLRPMDREELIGSTKNRFLNFLRNPIVELGLSKPDGHVDLTRAIRERSIIIVNLDRGGVLRDEDVEIFANLWLHEVLYAVYNTPRGERVPHFLMIDELPTFRSSFDVITSALAQVRKFLCRFVVAFQGTQLFDDRERDRLLNALVGQCNAHLYFRHKNPVDARYFGEIMRLFNVDPMRVKHTLTQQQQFQDGHELLILTDESESQSLAGQSGGSSSNATSDTTSTTEGSSTSTGTNSSSSTNSATGSSEGFSQLAHVVSAARTEYQGRSEQRSNAEQRGRSEQSGTSSSTGVSRGTTATSGASWSTTKTAGKSITRKQTLVPRILTREVVSAVQFFTTEEQLVEAAREITRLPRGECFLYLAGQGVWQVQVPLAHQPWRGLPTFTAKKLSELRRLILARPEFDRIDDLLRKRAEFEAKLVTFLQDMSRAKAARFAASHCNLLVPPAVNDDSIVQI